MRVSIALLALVLILPATAQKKSASSATASAAFDVSPYKGLKWRNIGPYRGGRANAISGVIQNDQTYYTGYTGGGIWKTEDAGKNW